MNMNHLKALDKLASTISGIEELMNSSNNNSFEDRQIYSLIENIIEDMKYTIHRIEYYKKTPISGELKEQPNGRFEIASHELTCGSPLEVYSTEYDEWFVGRVEHSEKYYFCCQDLDNPALHDGMEARIRL